MDTIDMIEMQLKGFEQVREALKGVESKIQNRALNKGVYEGSKLVREDARRRAPMHSGPYPEARTRGRGIKSAMRSLIKLSASGKDISLSDVEALAKSASRPRSQYYYRKPGTLRKGIIVSGKAKGMSPDSLQMVRSRTGKVLFVGLNKRAYYGKWMESGFNHYRAGRIMAQPFLEPALTQNTQTILARIGAYIRDEVERLRVI